MARTFKALHGDDVVNTRTLLHEAIPITGTISSGTYIELGTHAGAGTDLNVKAFSHGMFESVYDYPFLSSSANHIYDLTFGLSSEQSQSSAHTQQAKKLKLMALKALSTLAVTTPVLRRGHGIWQLARKKPPDAWTKCFS